MSIIRSFLIKVLTFISRAQVSIVLGHTEFAITEAQKDNNGIIYLTDDNFDKIFNLSQ